jgi:hypothetical protein
MSPTVFRKGKYRFFFFSREETREHIHIVSPEGEAKFWVEPIVALANYKGLTARQLNNLQKIVEEHKHEIKEAWKNHIRS